MENPVVADSDEQITFLLLSLSKQFRILLPIQPCTETWKNKSFFSFPNCHGMCFFPPEKADRGNHSTNTVSAQPGIQQLSWLSSAWENQARNSRTPGSVGSSLALPDLHTLLSRSLALPTVLLTDFIPSSLHRRRHRRHSWHAFVSCSRAELSCLSSRAECFQGDRSTSSLFLVTSQSRLQLPAGLTHQNLKWIRQKQPVLLECLPAAGGWTCPLGPGFLCIYSS